MVKKTDRGNVTLRLVDYGKNRGGREPRTLNALLYTPDLEGVVTQDIQERDPARFAILTLHGSEGHAMSGVNVWLAPNLASAGYSVMCPNKSNSGKCYYTSLFDWCEKDIASAIGFLETRLGFRNVVIVGHSLGAAEAAYYQAKTKDERISGLALLGAPIWPQDMGSEEKLQLARAHLEDRNAYFISDGNKMPVSAEHYLSYWSPGSNNDIRKWIGEVTVSLLMVDGEIPHGRLCGPKAGLRIRKLASCSPRTEHKIVRGAPHSFANHFEETSLMVEDWLDRLAETLKARKIL